MKYISNHIRFAIIRSIDQPSGKMETDWLDNSAERGQTVPIPHPFAGNGGEGIFVAPRVGQIVALDLAPNEQYVPVFTVPLRALNNSNNIQSVSEVNFDDINYPFLEDGDIVIQGHSGSKLRFDSTGNISFQNEFGEGKFMYGKHDITKRCNISVDSPIEYIISPAGLYARGIVKRDIRVEEGDDDFVDYSTSLESEQALEAVGWDPNRNISIMTRNPNIFGKSQTNSQKTILRNPALIEDRKIIFEYGRNFFVDNLEEEIRRFNEEYVIQSDPMFRRERRNNVLSLSLSQPNELIESVNGTLVDIFGNLLDINRNIINIPQGQGTSLLKNIFENMRHTVAFHMEINARKGWSYRDGYQNQKVRKVVEPPIKCSDPNQILNNARDRSRWFIDIDKEGLTKINIPANSETGNIPLLTRYETSSVLKVDDNGNVNNEKYEKLDEIKDIHRNLKNKDIILEQFGPGGISIETDKGKEIVNRLNGKKTSWVEDKQRLMPKYIEAGTAFHDITVTAQKLLTQNANKYSYDIFDNDIYSGDSKQIAVSNKLISTVPKENSNIVPNAGGRSLQINLDGSLEMSVGCNTADRVSWILDTAGAVVARLGRNKDGHSAIIHSDGDLEIEVGGYDFIGEGADDEVDTRFVGLGTARSKNLTNDPKRFRAGKVVLRVRRPNQAGNAPDSDNDDTLLIIDEFGVSIKTAGRLNFMADEDIRFKSKARIIIEGEDIQFFEDNPRWVGRYVTPDGGREI